MTEIYKVALYEKRLELEDQLAADGEEAENEHLVIWAKEPEEDTPEVREQRMDEIKGVADDEDAILQAAADLWEEEEEESEEPKKIKAEKAQEAVQKLVEPLD
jgi:hypothetical protein